MTARTPPPTLAPGHLAHLPSLDGLRGVAILLVLLHNFDVLDLGGARALGPVLVKEFLYIGWIGVQLFFVLSGYLITRGLLVTQTRPDYFERFFLKRVLRIFPLYYLALLVFLVLLPATGWVAQRSMQYSSLWLWTYLSNWTTPFEPTGGPLPHFWSLAVEEQFYLVWPLLLWKLRLRWVWRLCLGLTALAPLLRWGLVQQGLPDEALYEFTFSRMDALTAGAALAAWDQGRALHGATRWRAWHLQLLGLLLLMAAAVASHGFRRIGAVPQVVGYSLLALGFAAFTGWALLTDQARSRGASVSRWSAVLRWSVLRKFGQYSYAIYVFHKPLHDLVGEPLLARWTGHAHTAEAGTALLYFAAATAVTFALAWLSWQGFERHFMALKERLPSSFTASGTPGKPTRHAIRGTVTAAQRRNFKTPKAGLREALRGKPAPRR
ncbi:acyltransferase family protein [Sphaerotilus sp.]|uniref:acyltransferase family protein n=1 Tax=Sphaerotilus sp. TaxID=2093942 RepID=UPI0025D86CE5|nr:acyltransferase [Sphaerotilus sp.]